MNLADQAHQIIEHLPGTWTVKNAQHWIVTIERDDRTQLMIKSADRDRRLEIFIPPVSHVNRRGGTDYLHTDHPHITAAVSRGPEAIARDIQRRILPAAIEYRIKADLWLESQQNHDAEIEDARAKLLALPGAVESWNNTIHCRKCQRRSLQRKLCHRQHGALTIDQALAVAKPWPLLSPAWPGIQTNPERRSNPMPPNTSPMAPNMLSSPSVASAPISSRKSPPANRPAARRPLRAGPPHCRRTSDAACL